MNRCAWLYVAAVLICWLALRLGGDRWWWATAMLYAPRWGWALPLAILGPAAAFVRRARLPVALAALVAAGPLMGFCFGWPSGERTRQSRGANDVRGEAIRVLTCNIGQLTYDPLELAMLVVETEPDVITIQERMTVEELAAVVGPDWHVVGAPGITVASRFPIAEKLVFGESEASAWRTVAVDYRLATPGGPIDFVALHLLTPRKGIEAVKDDHWRGIDRMRANLERRSKESAAASRWVASLPGPAIVAGDMNLPPESELFKRDWSSFADAFAAAGCGYGYTFGYTTSGWLYGIRIDHILAGAGWQVERCWVGRHIGSDHRPVVADLRRSDGSGE
ncbi:MAG TPA: endonuclease/exonuclease/phosphatase family protein [Pirellulales bacterium]|nr:endonuclease/exonuclease/phosphatase family protein [Pirellulales bacterium]